MRRRKRSIWDRILLTALLIMLMCRPLPVRAESFENHRVLFISSYSYTWSTVPLQIEGIQSALDPSVTLDVEFMDTKMIAQDAAEQMVLERIRIKQDSVGKYDAVIVGDDAALRFAMAYRQELFPGRPIVFEGINDIGYAREVSGDPLVSGVIEQFSYEENLSFAKKIQPNADKVVAIVDDSVTKWTATRPPGWKDHSHCRHDCQRLCRGHSGVSGRRHECPSDEAAVHGRNAEDHIIYGVILKIELAAQLRSSKLLILIPALTKNRRTA